MRGSLSSVLMTLVIFSSYSWIIYKSSDTFPPRIHRLLLGTLLPVEPVLRDLRSRAAEPEPAEGGEAWVGDQGLRGRGGAVQEVPGPSLPRGLPVGQV